MRRLLEQPLIPFVATVAVLVAGFTLTACECRADEGAAPAIARPGEFVVSLTRLVPLVAFRSTKVDTSLPNDAAPTTSFLVGSDPTVTNVYDVPRLGFDFVLPRRFTLGLEVAGIASLSGSPSLGDPPKVSLFGIAPHVGYLAVLNRYVAAWLRAGAAYYETSSEGVNGAGGATVSYSWTWRQLDATVEGHMLFTPLPHVGVTVGVYGELPLHGSFEEERSVGPGVTANASSLELGVVAGILTYL